MKALLAAAGVVLAAAAFQATAFKPSMSEGAAETYEHLANAIIEIRATEDNLVKGILMHHYVMALKHLEQAESATTDNRREHLEKAATEVTYLANEGDKRVQAVRQRLLKAGHHHHTDAETKEDYIWIDSREKKALLDLAGRIGRAGADVGASQIRQFSEELGRLYRQAVQPE